MESRSSQCLICDATLADADVALIKLEMDTGTDTEPPSRRPRLLPEGAAASDDDHIRSLCKLMGLTSASRTRLMTGLPNGDRHFCGDCTSNLCTVSQLFNDILKLQRKIGRFRVKVKSQIRACQNQSTSTRSAKTVRELREILVESLKKGLDSPTRRDVPETPEDDYHDEENDETGSDPLYDPLCDSDHDADDFASHSDEQTQRKTHLVRTKKEPGHQQGSEFRLKECTVILHDTMAKAATAATQSSSSSPSRRGRKSRKKFVEPKEEKKAPRKPRRTRPTEKSPTISEPSGKKPIRKHGRKGLKLSKDFLCTECPAVFPRLNYLTYHCLKKHQLSEYNEFCSNCGKRFFTKSALVTHASAQGGACKKPPLPPDVTPLRAPGPYQYQCNICNYKMTTRTRVSNHVVTHTKIKQFTCDICGNNFTTSTGLIAHRLSLHPETVPESQQHPYQCQFEGCGKSFGNAGVLRIHQKKAHLNLLDYPCTECDFKTHTATLLRIHNEINHLGLRKFECKVCGVALKRNGLKKHMLAVHTAPEDRPYKCKFLGCGKTFCDGYNQRRHEILHTGEKPVQCQICLRRFAVPEYLKLHMKKHKREDRTPFQDEATDLLTQNSDTAQIG